MWVLGNIAVKPGTKFLQFDRKIRRPVTDPRANEQQDIRNFLVDRPNNASPLSRTPPQPTDRPPPGRQQGIMTFFRPVLDIQPRVNVSERDIFS